MKYILASQSPRRQQLLKDAGLVFEIMTMHTEENFPENMISENVPQHIAQEKALAVKNNLEEHKNWDNNTTIIAADTIVLLDHQILGKPKNKTEAYHMLTALSGKKHQVITGVYLINDNYTKSFSVVTEVFFNPLTNEQIDFYITQYQPFDKAGAYAIQEWIGLIGIHKINGDFYNVMGLPVSQLLPALKAMHS